MKRQGAGNEEMSCSGIGILQSVPAAEGLVLDIWLPPSTGGQLLTAVSETEETEERLGVRSLDRTGET